MWLGPDLTIGLALLRGLRLCPLSYSCWGLNRVPPTPHSYVDVLTLVLHNVTSLRRRPLGGTLIHVPVTLRRRGNWGEDMEYRLKAIRT